MIARTRKATARFAAFIVSFYIRASARESNASQQSNGFTSLRELVRNGPYTCTHAYACAAECASPFADPLVQSGGFAREASSTLHRNRFAPDTDLAIE